MFLILGILFCMLGVITISLAIIKSYKNKSEFSFMLVMTAITFDILSSACLILHWI